MELRVQNIIMELSNNQLTRFNMKEMVFCKQMYIFANGMKDGSNPAYSINISTFNTINYDYEKTFHYFFDACYGCNN